tara:strand:+ start:525 stop:1214 length:690 start_codon:yes stop_codon:yes gene_type:complete
MGKTQWKQAKRLLRKHFCENYTENVAEKIKCSNWVLALGDVSVQAITNGNPLYFDMNHPDIVEFKANICAQMFLYELSPLLNTEFLTYMATRSWDAADPVCIAYDKFSQKAFSLECRVVVLHRDNQYIMTVPRLLTDLRTLLAQIGVDTGIFECPVCYENTRYLNSELYKCTHGFCNPCVGKFIDISHSSCPICRAEMREGEDCELKIKIDVGPEFEALARALALHEIS